MPIIVSSSVGKLVYSSSGSVSYDKSNKITYQVESLSGSLVISSSLGKSTLASTGSISYGPSNTVVSGGTSNLLSSATLLEENTELPKNHNALLYGPITVDSGNTLTIKGTLKIKDIEDV